MRTKQNKKIVLWSVFGVLCLGLLVGIFLGFQKPKQEYSDTVAQIEDVQEEARHPRESGDPGIVPLDSPIRGNTAVGESEDQTSTIRSIAILKINSVELEIIVEEQTSVYDAMKLLAQQGKLRFEGKEYLGLGFFVTQIESLESGNGKNLMYDINGKEASVGISSYILKEGDIIEWKLK